MFPPDYQTLTLVRTLIYKKLRTYGEKFKKMTDDEAWEYISDIEKFCRIVVSQGSLCLEFPAYLPH